MSQEPNTIWEFNGEQFSIDIGDAIDAQHFQEVMDRFAVAEKNIPKNGSMVDHIVAYDKLFRDMYDDLFGNGAGDKILGTKKNMRNVDNAYESFLAFIDKQGSVMQERRAAISNKYNGNRLQRRASK